VSELEAEKANLEEENNSLQAQVADLQAQVADLQSQLQAAQAAAMKPKAAAPMAKPQPKVAAKKAAPPPPPPAYEPEGEAYEALYTFKGEQAGDLAFSKGDIIYVTNTQDGGWWEGTCNGMSGAFPSNYVRKA